MDKESHLSMDATNGEGCSFWLEKVVTLTVSSWFFTPFGLARESSEDFRLPCLLAQEDVSRSVGLVGPLGDSHMRRWSIWHEKSKSLLSLIFSAGTTFIHFSYSHFDSFMVYSRQFCHSHTYCLVCQAVALPKEKVDKERSCCWRSWWVIFTLAKIHWKMRALPGILAASGLLLSFHIAVPL